MMILILKSQNQKDQNQTKPQIHLLNLKEMKKKIDTDMANIKLLRQYLWRNDNASKSL